MRPEPFYNADPYLGPFAATITDRNRKCIAKEAELVGEGTLQNFAMGHH